MWKTPTVLVTIVLVLMALGIVMLASTSGIKAQTLYADPHYFVKRQLVWILLALIVGYVAAMLNYHHWRYLAVPLFVLAVVLLGVVLVPGLGSKIGGSRRWLHFHALNFQPSELGKFSMVLMLAWWLVREQRNIHKFLRGAAVPTVLILGVIAVLIFLEPDFGTAILCAVAGMAIMFVGGARLWYLFLLAVPGAAAFVVILMHDPLRMQRILAFLDPEKYQQTFSYQLLAAIKAFVIGGVTGVGLGASMQKQHYLPEAHTDFIFAIIGEELGVVGTLFVLMLFAGLFCSGLKISLRAPDMFGKLLAFGIVLMITMQALINIGVVTGCGPTKGLPLPFISFGGSSMVMSLLGVGILVNIAQHGVGAVGDDEIRPAKDRLHRF